MFNATYRAVIIGTAKSAANYVAPNLSNRELNDFGHTRSSFISAFVQNLIRDLDEVERSRNQGAIRKPAQKGTRKLNSLFNENNAA